MNMKIKTSEVTGDRFQSKLDHADRMSKQLTPTTTGARANALPVRTDDETWLELVRIADAIAKGLK